jgi:SAM-dependent methyltransferase
VPLPLTTEDLDRYLTTLQAPGPQLDFLQAAAFRAAGAAVRLGVFEELADGPLPPADLAGRLGVDERGLVQLLGMLERFGYLTTDPGGVTNTDLTRKWLLSAGGGYLTVFSFWHTVLFELWGDLERSVRTGEPAVDFYQWLEGRPDTMRAFQTMLTRLAGWLCPEVLERVPVGDGDRRMLDVGGGHATYAVGFCRRYPELHATVVDLPGALEIGAEAVAAAEIGDRVTLRAGDLRTVDLDRDFDLALLFNIVHGLDPAAVRSLLSEVATALRSGGRLVLLEPLADLAEAGGVAGAAFVGTFSLNLFHSQGGQIYTERELAGWLRDAGFRDVQRHPLTKSPTDHLIIAVRD